GKRFGTLCAAHHDRQVFSKKEIKLLGQNAALFSYYLELENKTFKDSLTGLYNSNFLKDYYSQIVKNSGLAILMDLDGFKRVNDSLGHLKGDLVLQEVGKILIKLTDAFHDTYSVRMGGDEFIIFINDKLSMDEIEAFLNKLILMFNQ